MRKGDLESCVTEKEFAIETKEIHSTDVFRE